MQTENQQSLNEKVLELLDERQQMLVLFCRLAGLDPFDDHTDNRGLLQNFCQVLVDYSALWHFEILEGVLNDSDRFAQALHEVKLINDRILEANEVAIAFSDKYESRETDPEMDYLSRDLSALGEELAGRIEAEDQILHAMII